MQWGLDSFSLYLHFGRHQYRPAKPVTLEWFLDLAQELGVAGVQLDPLHHDKGEDDARRVGEACASRGLFVEWGMGGFDPDSLSANIRLAHLAGAKRIRTFVSGSRPTPEQVRDWSALAIDWFGQVMPLAEEHDVTIGLENHGDFTAEELLRIVEGVGHPRFGACLDVGNNANLGEDPLSVVRLLAPHAVNVHFKDGRVAGRREIEYTALGQGELPLAEMCALLRGARPGATVMLEIVSQPLDGEAETLAAELLAVRESVRYARETLFG